MIRFGSVDFDIGDPALDRGALRSDYVDLVRAFLHDTYATVAFYRRRFDAAKLDLGGFASLDDLRKLPPMGPHDVAAASELDLVPAGHAAALQAGDLGALPPGARIAKKFQSSGSTGRPKTSFYTVDDWDAAQATILRTLAHLPRGHFARVFNGFHPGHFAGKLYEDTLNRAGFHVENKHFAGTNEQTLRQLYASIGSPPRFSCLALPPRAPSGATTKGYTLADMLNDDHENFIGKHIRAIILSGAARDLPGDDLKAAVWEVNDLAGAPRAVFVDTYGTSECAGPAAAECEAHDGFHLIQGFTYTEVIDEATGKPAVNGQTGLVVSTGLKHGSRYIRYVVGDEATYVTDPCACGRVTPRLKNVNRVLEKERLVDGCAAGW